jgi:hypothetical protein
MGRKAHFRLLNYHDRMTASRTASDPSSKTPRERRSRAQPNIKATERFLARLPAEIDSIRADRITLSDAQLVLRAENLRSTADKITREAEILLSQAEEMSRLANDLDSQTGTLAQAVADNTLAVAR